MKFITNSQKMEFFHIYLWGLFYEAHLNNQENIKYKKKWYEHGCWLRRICLFKENFLEEPKLYLNVNFTKKLKVKSKFNSNVPYKILLQWV